VRFRSGSIYLPALTRPIIAGFHLSILEQFKLEILADRFAGVIRRGTIIYGNVDSSPMFYSHRSTKVIPGVIFRLHPIQRYCSYKGAFVQRSSSEMTIPTLSMSDCRSVESLMGPAV